MTKDWVGRLAWGVEKTEVSYRCFLKACIFEQNLHTDIMLTTLCQYIVSMYLKVWIMRRADRLLQIVQILRRERKPVSAQSIADELEVTVRTVYRDMVAMESINVPVRGEAGIGYVLEDGYDLPPLIFDSDELEALMLGMRFVHVHGDPDQILAAKNVVAKIGAVLPAKLREEMFGVSIYAPPRSRPVPAYVDTKAVRDALRAEKIIKISYRNEAGDYSERVIWPIGLGYFDTTRIVVAWCTLRQDYRSFRVDRIERLDITDDRIPRARAVMLKEWIEQDKRQNRSY